MKTAPNPTASQPLPTGRKTRLGSVIGWILLPFHRLKQRLTGEDLVEEWHQLSADPEFMRSIEQARTQIDTTGGLTTEELRRELGLPDNSK